nr:hypothetical protein [Tanacetum cinerariifolium]
SNAIFALSDHGSTSSVGRKSNAIFALPGHGSTSSVGRKSNAIFTLSGHGSTSSVGPLSKAREDDEQHQESRQDRPTKLCFNNAGWFRTPRRTAGASGF